MNIESRRCSNEINQLDYIFSYLISQYTINSNLIKTKELVWKGNTTAGSEINIGKISDLIPSGATYFCTVVKYCAGDLMHDPCNAMVDYSYTYLTIFPTKTQNSVIVNLIIFYR